MPLIDTTGIRPIERRQPTDDVSRVRRRDEGTSSAFRPQTNVALKTAIQDLSATLSKISSEEKYGIQKMPKEIGDVVKNILRQAFSMDATLGKGIGSTIESQRFSMDQLMLFSRLLSQMGVLAEKNYSMRLSDETQVLLSNLKDVVVAQDGGEELEPVLMTKSAFELVDAKIPEQLPQALYEMLAQLANIPTANQQTQPPSEGMQFLKQLVRYFIPRPEVDDLAQEQESKFIEQEPQNQQGQSTRTPSAAAQKFLDSMFRNFGGKFANQTQQPTPQGQPTQFNQPTPQGQQPMQFNQPTPQGQQPMQFNQPTSQGQQPMQFNQLTPQGQQPMQFNQPTPKGQPMQFNQSAPQGQQPMQFNQLTPQGQPTQFNPPTPQGQQPMQFNPPTPQGQQPAQFNQPTPQGQPTQFNPPTPQGQPTQFNKPTPQGQPTQFNQPTPQGQQPMQFNQPTPQGQLVQFNQSAPQGQQPMQFNQTPSQGQQPMQFNKPTPQGQQPTQFNQSTPQGQQPTQFNQSTPQGQPTQFNQTAPQGQQPMQFNKPTPQGQPTQFNQPTPQGQQPMQFNQPTPQGQPVQFNQSAPQGQPTQFNQPTPQGQPTQFNQSAPQGQQPMQFNQPTPQGQPVQFNQSAPQGQQPMQFNQTAPQGQQPMQFNQPTPQGQQPMQFNQSTPQGQQPMQFNQPTPQGQPTQFNQPTPQGQQPAQFNQPTPQGQPVQFNQSAPQGQQPMQFSQTPPQGQPTQFNQTAPQSQPAQFNQTAPQGQPAQFNQPTTPQGQQAQFNQQTPQGQQAEPPPPPEIPLPTFPLNKKFVVRQKDFRKQMDAEKTELIKTNLLNTPQTLNTMRDLAQFLMKNTESNARDTALFKNFINNSQEMMPETEARHLQNLLRLCQQNIPFTVRQAAVQQNLPDLPRLWAFMQMCDMARLNLKMTPKALKRAGKDVAAFATSMRGAMSSDNAVVQNQRSFQMMVPLYMGDNETSYPTYFNIYDENEQDPDTGENKKETWVRICILTDHVGAVELVFRIYDDSKLDMRFYFSQSEIAKEFGDIYVNELKKSMKNYSLNLGEISVGSVGEGLFNYT